MKICLYSPYIPKHTGGGEMYLLQVAECLLEDSHQVFLAIGGEGVAAGGQASAQAQTIIDQYQTAFNLNLAGLEVISTPLNSPANFLQKLLWTRQFDVVYYLTDGSIFASLAKHKSILHLQFPFTQRKSLLEQFKLLTWRVKNTNSEFTRGVVEKSWPTKIDLVHSPYVELSQSPTAPKKEKVILHIGRFFRQLHSKRQDVLVESFKELRKRFPEESQDWKLVMIGGIEDQDYADEVKNLSQGQPIEFYHDLNRDQVEEWLFRSKIYWHATGFGVDQALHPEKVEHFGISTIEAMAAGLVPVVINLGGQPEILADKLRECLWNTQLELVDITQKLMTDKERWQKLSQLAQQRARHYSKTRFASALKQMLN